MSRFNEMLDRKAEDIKAPPTLPPGIYVARIPRPHEKGEIESTKKNTKYDKVTFLAELTAPHEVDEVLLEEYGRPIQGKKLPIDFLFDQKDDVAAEDSLNRMKVFLMDHLHVMEEGMSIGQGMANAVGAEFLIEVINEPDQTPGSERKFERVRRTMTI